MSEGLDTLAEAVLSVLEGADDEAGVEENGEPLLLEEEVVRDAAPKADVPLVDPPNMDPEDEEGALEVVKDEEPPKGDPNAAVLPSIDLPESAAAPKTDPDAAAGEAAPKMDGLVSALTANRPTGGLVSATSGVLDLDLSGVPDFDLSTTTLEDRGTGEAVCDFTPADTGGVADLALTVTPWLLVLAAGGPPEVSSGVADLAFPPARGEEAARPANIPPELLEAGDETPKGEEAAPLAPKGEAVAAVPRGAAAALAPNGKAAATGFVGVRENVVEAPPPKPNAGFAPVS